MSQRSERNVEAGEVIAERYRIEAPIGRGAMGSVWRARHVGLDAPVAIKFLNAAIAGDPVILERFMREARAAAAVRSSHVVQIFDYGVDAGTPFIAMELLVGETLDARLAARGPLAPPEVDRIFGEIARAVGVAHDLGVVHRDIKPANIFIAREGDHEVTKVLDFGIAKLVESKVEAPAARTTDTGILLGTPHYMSPEQARGHRQVDHRADLWALAVLAFECLTGRQPFESDTLGDLVVKICTGAPLLPSALAPLPPAFDRWFLRGVSKEPSARFGSIAEMASELHALLAAERLAAARPSSAPVPRRLTWVGTEVIGGATAGGRAPGGADLRASRVEDGAASAPHTASSEPTPSLNATAVAAEIAPRQRPARRGRRIAAALGFAALLASLLLRRSAPPHASAGHPVAPAAADAPAARAMSTPNTLVPARGAPVAAALPVTAEGMPAPSDAMQAAAATRASSAPSAAPDATARAPALPARALPDASPKLLPSATRGAAPRREAATTRPAAPARPGHVRRPAPNPSTRSGAPSLRAPAPPAAEVVRDPASVPPAAADPYADRL